MGFFSYTCAKSNLPILASISWGTNLCEVVLLTPNTKPQEGYYDGYGRLSTENEEEINLPWDDLETGAAKLVIKTFYEGETFEEIPGQSNREPGQGHFHDRDTIQKWSAQKGFPSYEAYLTAFKEAYGF